MGCDMRFIGAFVLAEADIPMNAEDGAAGIDLEFGGE
jgi:hypothetical protein